MNPAENMPALEEMGFVTSLSGILIVIDTGYLNIWSHDQDPILPNEALDSDASTERANQFIDLRIVGPDAERAGRVLDMSSHPLFIYDQPPDHPDLQQRFDEIVGSQKLDAKLEVVAQRISHRQRVDLALQQGSGSGEVQYHGVPACVIGGVPVGQSLRVLGERVPVPDQNCWRRVVVACEPEGKVAKSEFVGAVGVDYARLLIADVDSLGAWEHEKSLDGLADFVFWGLDAERAAQALKAPARDKGNFGWLDVPEAFAQEHGIAVEEYKETNGLKMATDYRPHSHHWQVMKTSRTSATESGMTEVGGVTVCNFLTTWGDGLFDVYRDLSESGKLVQIRVELGK